MKTFDELVLVKYCHLDCIPLMNIMRLPKAKRTKAELTENLAHRVPAQ